MTRTGTKWITMVIVLVLTTGAWADRERERDRKRPNRRSETRSMADEYRGDGERQERENQNRNRERSEREREERGKREDRNRDRDRDEHRRMKPDVRIFRFEHIPAESFMEVLGQLSRKGPLGEILSKIPIALHQHSNAVVVIAPPEAMELFEKLADGLDAPSAFHQRMAQGKKPGAYKKPDAHKKPGQKKPASPKHPTPGKGPAGINEEAIIKVMGNPVGELFGKILSDPAARELRLEKQQREAMHKIARQCGEKVGHMRQRVIQAIRGMNHEQRSANARKLVSHVRGEMGKMAGEARKHIFGILKPEQRKAAGRILGAPGPAGSKGRPSPTAAPSGRGGCRNR